MAELEQIPGGGGGRGGGGGEKGISGLGIGIVQNGGKRDGVE